MPKNAEHLSKALENLGTAVQMDDKEDIIEYVGYAIKNLAKLID